MNNTSARAITDHTDVWTVAANRAARHRQKERERKARRRAENLRIVAACKALGCFLCRTIERELHFHHIKQKKCEIAHMLTRSTQAVRLEISRCMLLCRRCHTEHHETIVGQTDGRNQS